jgi:hypothetical protein
VQAGYHTERRRAFFFVARALYSRKVRSHKLARLARELGIKLAPRTILRNLRECDIRVRYNRPLRIGVYGRGKIKSLPRGLEAVALAFASWFNLYFSGGSFDVEAILRGEKPP